MRSSQILKMVFIYKKIIKKAQQPSLTSNSTFNHGLRLKNLRSANHLTLSKEKIMDSKNQPRVDTEIQNEIQEEIREKLILELLFEFVFHSPALFELARFNEDTKSGFLLVVHRALPKILNNFDSTKGSFFSYFVSDVRMLVKGYLRDLAKNKACEDSLSFCYATHHDHLYEIREPEPEYNAEECYARFKCTHKSEKTLLVLALKNAYTITDKQIKQISHITGFENAKLTSLVERAKMSILPKAAIRQKMIESRNKTYYLKTRNGIELERLSPESSQYCVVKKQYANQVHLMNKKNELLKSKLSLSPSNSCVGSLLNIPPRNVTRLITQAANTFKLGKVDKAGKNKIP